MGLDEQQKHIRPILDIYDSAFAEVSRNRVILVQQVSNDGVSSSAFIGHFFCGNIVLVCTVKTMSMVRSRAWKRAVTQAQETIAAQASELKVCILCSVHCQVTHPSLLFQEATDTSEYINSFMQLLNV